jgi:hypothetical protein
LSYERTETPEGDDALFALQVRVLQDVDAIDALRLAPADVFRSEAYVGDAVYSLETGNPERQAANVYIQPNPARGSQVFVYGLPQGAYRLQVYDAGGRLMWRGDVAGPGAVQIPASAFGSAGLYWCIIYGGAGVQTNLKVMWLPE